MEINNCNHSVHFLSRGPEPVCLPPENLSEIQPGANISGANLTEANFKGVQGTKFTRSDS